MSERTIKVDYLARVEGEGAFYLKVDDSGVQNAQLKIFEPPRFFEAFLKGRSYAEAPDITARICGICPVAYQMSSVHAIEKILGITPGPVMRDLRRLLYCGEWIESHTLHVYMLHAPDFLGYEGAVEMAKDHKNLVERGLKIKKAGNLIVQTLGGREIHPINIKVGGFYRIPKKSELMSLREELLWARDAARETVEWVAGLEFPELIRDYEFVAMSHEKEYPFNEGRIISSAGLDIAFENYENCFQERHIEYTNALHSVKSDGEPYFVGPMARMNLNFAKLPPEVQQLSDEVGLTWPCKNPFKSIIIRSLEIYYSFVESIRIIDQFNASDISQEDMDPKIDPKPGVGCHATEAPRGLLYHRFELDEQGDITFAKIVAPTSQNQMTIEHDLRDFANQNLNMSDEKLRDHCEQAIRNYDPCISCATHFLKLKVDRV